MTPPNPCPAKMSPLSLESVNVLHSLNVEEDAEEEVRMMLCEKNSIHYCWL